MLFLLFVTLPLFVLSSSLSLSLLHIRWHGLNVCRPVPSCSLDKLLLTLQGHTDRTQRNDDEEGQDVMKDTPGTLDTPVFLMCVCVCVCVCV